MTPASSIGKYKWWDVSTEGYDYDLSWWNHRTMCFTPDKDVKYGQKFSVSYKLGQSKKFISLGYSESLLLGTRTDRYGNTYDQEFPVDEFGNEISVLEPCDGVAFISPRIPPKTPGAYVIRITAYDKKGSTAWTTDSILLGKFMGAESGATFFANPPNLFFTSKTYSFISPRYGIKAFTNTGKPRNACLIIYDIVIQNERDRSGLKSSTLVSMMQVADLGLSIKRIAGDLAIQTAIKCAPWIADNLG